jgi:hypothetical protein
MAPLRWTVIRNPVTTLSGTSYLTGSGFKLFNNWSVSRGNP